MDLMAIIQFLVQSHLLPVVAHRPVGMETAVALAVAALMEAPMVALARAGKEIMVVMVVPQAAVAAAGRAVRVEMPLAHT
jgi:hypothetical protein